MCHAQLLHFLNQLPANAAEEAEGDSPRATTAFTHVGDLVGLLRSRFWPGPGLAMQSLGNESKQRDLFLSLSLTLSNEQNRSSKEANESALWRAASWDLSEMQHFGPVLCGWWGQEICDLTSRVILQDPKSEDCDPNLSLS